MTTSKYIAMASQAVPASEHEHSWQTRSSHHTSTGIVQYLQCLTCKTQQMRQMGFGCQVPKASKEIRA
ncbi:hypothetical protein AQ436_08260 [Arthrobacter sp. EpRS66]|nr:hypothetical protein AQ436_08260 [Arthrobacter sp. EpRS66]